MTYRAFIQQLALRLGLSNQETWRIVGEAFALLRDTVLDGSRVSIPRFGTFHRAQTRAGTRHVGPHTLKVPPSFHVRFRSAKAAKERAE